MHTQSLIHSIITLCCSGLVMAISIVLKKYIKTHPGKSKPANGKSPLFLGTGNGIGIVLWGDFDRQPINSQSVTAQYAFICLFIPIIPIGCYNAETTSFSSKMGKGSTTTYNVSGTQPWRFIEVIQIYCWWYSFVGLGLAIIGIIASLFGENFL